MSTSLVARPTECPVVARMPLEPNWYAIYTVANQEKLVAERLEFYNIECYLPLFETVRRRTDRRVTLRLPLFPGYLFVRIALGEKLQVLKTPGVVRIIGSTTGPISVPNEDIELLQRGLSAPVKAEAYIYLKKGCRVRIVNGPFSGTEGILLRRKCGLRVVISIEVIRRAFTIEVAEKDIERIW